MSSKDRKIANQNVMIKNRDKLIEHQTKRVAQLEATLKQIKAISSSNKYNHPEIYLRKINELASDIN